MKTAEELEKELGRLRGPKDLRIVYRGGYHLTLCDKKGQHFQYDGRKGLHKDGPCWCQKKGG